MARATHRERTRKRNGITISNGSDDGKTAPFTSKAGAKMDCVTVRIERLSITSIRTQESAVMAAEEPLTLSSDIDSLNSNESTVSQKGPKVPRKRRRPPSTGDYVGLAKAKRVTWSCSEKS